MLLILNSPSRPGKGGTYNENNNWLGSPTVLLQRVIAWNNTPSQRGGSAVESQRSRPVFFFLQADAYLGVSPGGLCKLLPLPSHRDLTVITQSS